MAIGEVEEDKKGLRRGIPAAEEFEALLGVGSRGLTRGIRYFLGSPRYLEAEGVSMNGAAERLQALEAAGKTTVVLANSQEVIGILALADAPRARIADAVAQLTALGVRGQAIISGDNESVTRAIASAAGVEEFHGRLLPEHKLSLVAEYRARFGTVDMS